MRAHQPGSEPIDIPETIPNPVVVPKPTPTPIEPAPKEPVRIPEKVPGTARVSKQLCAHELEDKPKDATWPKYCPNEQTIEALEIYDIGNNAVLAGYLLGQTAKPYSRIPQRLLHLTGEIELLTATPRLFAFELRR